MSTLNVNTVQSSTSNPPIFKNSGGDVVGTLARAWVNFNGVGTVAIRDSFNVSSITDNGTGDYTVNFTNPMSNTNYCLQLSATDDGTGGNQADGYAYGVWKRGANSTALTTSSARIQVGYAANEVLYDQSHVMVTIFGS